MFAIVPGSYAEKATELYIPIGKSPGLSGKYSVIGRIEQINNQNKTITMSDASGKYAVKVLNRTLIFLDYRKMKKTNRYGAFADFKPGMTVEVRFEKDERGLPAEWVKIQMVQ